MVPCYESRKIRRLGASCTGRFVKMKMLYVLLIKEADSIVLNLFLKLRNQRVAVGVLKGRLKVDRQ